MRPGCLAQSSFWHSRVRRVVDLPPSAWPQLVIATSNKTCATWFVARPVRDKFGTRVRNPLGDDCHRPGPQAELLTRSSARLTPCEKNPPSPASGAKIASTERRLGESPVTRKNGASAP